MSSIMQYKGYLGSVEFSDEDDVFFGKVQGIRSLISYEGTTAKELREDFHGAVDDYLSYCEEAQIEPETAYKGSFNVRVSPDLHRKLVILASRHQMSVNSYVEEAVRNSVVSDYQK